MIRHHPGKPNVKTIEVELRTDFSRHLKNIGDAIPLWKTSVVEGMRVPLEETQNLLFLSVKANHLQREVMLIRGPNHVVVRIFHHPDDPPPERWNKENGMIHLLTTMELVIVRNAIHRPSQEREEQHLIHLKGWIQEKYQCHNVEIVTILL